MLNTVEERRIKIINYLKKEQFMTVSDLVDSVNYSEATVKRDLVELENQGLIRRTRGGAMIIDNSKIDVPYMMKISNYDTEKNKENMAKLAQTLVKDDMTLFLDSSTTSLHLINELTKFNGLQIITNGVMTASVLSQFTTASVSILGGKLVPSRYTVNGSKAYDNALTYNTDIAFTSCKGFDFSVGATEADEGEALMKQAFRSQSNKVALMVTSEKLGHKYLNQSLACHDIDYLILDKPLEKEDREKLEKHRISIMY